MNDLVNVIASLSDNKAKNIEQKLNEHKELDFENISEQLVLTKDHFNTIADSGRMVARLERRGRCSKGKRKLY